MRILVVSDSHRDYFALARAAAAEPTAAAMLFLGDGLSEFDDVAALHPTLECHAVRGNCDIASDEQPVRLVELGGVRIVMTHGHLYGAKYGTDGLFRLAREYGARIVLYGHTHAAAIEYQDGVYCVNPGSVAEPRDGAPSYACVDLLPNGILPQIVRMG